MNKQHKVFLFGIVILLAGFIPYTLLFMGSIDEGEGGGESSEGGEDAPLSVSNKLFPEEYLYNITSINEIKGYNISGSFQNNIESLKFVDDEFYVCKGYYNNSLDKYEFNIEFNFNADTSTYLFDYFDLFLYLDVGVSIFSDNIWFQVNIAKNETETEYNWVNYQKILAEEVHINRSYFENCIGFRLKGEADSDKVITIDRVNLLMSHGDEFYNQSTNLADKGVGASVFIGVTLYTIHWDGDYWYALGKSGFVDGAVIFQFYENWTLRQLWSRRAGDLAMPTLLGGIGSNGTHHYVGSWSSYDRNIYRYYDNWTYIDKKPCGNLQNWDLEYKEGYLYGLPMSGDGIQEFYINNLSLRTIHHVSGLGGGQGQLDWDGNYWWVYKSSTNMLFKIDASFNLINSYDISHLVDLYPGGLQSLVIKNDDWWFAWHSSGSFRAEQFYHIEFFNITRVYTAPPSPIATLENFDIQCQLDSYTVSYVKAYIKNESWNSGWIDMHHHSGDIWKTNILNIKDYDGHYTVWINASINIFSIDKYNNTKVGEYSTYNFTTFDITNSRPRLIFNAPKPNEEVIQLYNYNVNITVNDLEGDSYENVSIKIFQTDNESNVIINWTDMERYDVLKPNIWNYTFQPIMFENGIYTIRVRARDEKGFGYNETFILIQNNPPNITIISPILTELTDTSLQIICNITNEEPINEAKWDIVSTLGDYDWKNLTFNPSSGNWEDNVDLLEYAYGDYYLVINAIDDKFNSSFEIKNIQIHPLLTYYIPTGSISYTSSGITVSTGGTAEVKASFTLVHHSSAKERDFEVYIPEDFNDAHNYYITRGFNTYYPTGFFIEGLYTLWNLPDSQPTDTIHFSLEQPKLINQPFKEEEGEYQLTFTLSAKHSFTSLTIKNALAEYIPEPENYEYAVFYNFGDEWVEIEEIEIEPGANIDFSYTWDYIDANSTIEFKFTATQLDIQETDWTPVIVGATLGVFGVGIAAFILVGLKKHEDWGKLKVVLLAAGIGAAAGVVGYLIVAFF